MYIAVCQRFLWAILLIGSVFLSTVFAQPASELPPEAIHTLRLIQQSGPFPYERDGVVFGNFEKQLPKQPRGYYHEYTVKTPGERSRGARRIVAGGNPPVVFYYTDDHYRTFRQIQDKP